jgi:hypothetical protein
MQNLTRAENPMELEDLRSLQNSDSKNHYRSSIKLEIKAPTVHLSRGFSQNVKQNNNGKLLNFWTYSSLLPGPLIFSLSFL